MAKKSRKNTSQDIVPDIAHETIASGLTDNINQADNINPTNKGQTPMAKEQTNAHNEDEELGSIMEYTDDIDDAEAPLPLPEGQYEAEIKAVEAKKSGNDKKYAAVSFFIPVEAYPADFPVEEAPDGLTLIYRRLSLENNKMSRFNIKRFIQNIGAPPVGRTLDITQWVGLRAKVVIKHDVWEGVKRPTIDKVIASS